MADILKTVSSDYQSLVLPLLADSPNRAMDAALVDAVICTTGPARVDLLNTLIRRRHTPSLARLVDSYGRGSPILDRLLANRVRDLESGLRAAAGGEAAAARLAAISLIVDANDPSMAYILAQAMAHPDEPTRMAAGEGLHHLVTRFLYRKARAATVGVETPAVPVDKPVRQLANALGQVIQRWEHHTDRSVLESAMRMGLEIRDDVARKLDRPRNELRRPIERLLDRTNDPRLAEFALTALSIPPLRAVAVRTISVSRDVHFIEALVRRASVLQDEAVRRGCRWIKHIEWLDIATDQLLGRDDRAQVGVIRLLSASGASAEEKLKRYRRLLDEGTTPVRRMALEAAGEDASGVVQNLLTLLAIRADDDLADITQAMLKKQGHAASDPKAGEPGNGVVDRYFQGELPLVKVDRAAMRRALHGLPGGALVDLRRRLASTDPLTKARALQLARAVGLASELVPQVYALVHDADPVVRSVAVSLLAMWPGPTSQRLARAAVEDGDDRVRASGVEAMDELDVGDRAACSQPFLSSRCQRLRANAVKSLLTLSNPRAGETLLDMLVDPSPAHRMSALWVADRLRLRSVAAEVQKLATLDPNSRVQQRARRVLQSFAQHEAPHDAGVVTATTVRGGANR